LSGHASSVAGRRLRLQAEFRVEGTLRGLSGRFEGNPGWIHAKRV
jgi:hypothetical protein